MVIESQPTKPEVQTPVPEQKQMSTPSLPSRCQNETGKTNLYMQVQRLGCLVFSQGSFSERSVKTLTLTIHLFLSFVIYFLLLHILFFHLFCKMIKFCYFYKLNFKVREMYGLLTKREVKTAEYWPSSFFACLWTEAKSTSINSQKKNEANIQPS